MLEDMFAFRNAPGKKKSDFKLEEELTKILQEEEAAYADMIKELAKDCSVAQEEDSEAEEPKEEEDGVVVELPPEGALDPDACFQAALLECGLVERSTPARFCFLRWCY